ncbi:hypothetical protein PoB_005653100 [Plakobranchus ocellatus]|uniref:Uncharacterized protein n=1 Tax=Plakobranchus ocellatus TaxID=259542 RepID=A0AAV4C3V7_9GAST|nr:hypothetical protein PoB_005653100 [Plakobranchus ocellatus]
MGRKLRGVCNNRGLLAVSVVDKKNHKTTQRQNASYFALIGGVITARNLVRLLPEPGDLEAFLSGRCWQSRIRDSNWLVARKVYNDVTNQGYSDFTFMSLADIFELGGKYRGLDAVGNKPFPSNFFFFETVKPDF